MTADGSEISPQTARPRRWCDGLPSVTATIPCGGKWHRITWRRGKLVLEDHDLLAERSLAALGAADPPACMEVLEAWRRMRGPELLYEFLFRDKKIPSTELTFRRTRFADALRRLNTPPPVPPHVGAAWRQAMSASIQREKRMWEITLIETLPVPLRKMLALSVIVAFERQWHHETYRRMHEQHIASALTKIMEPLFEQSVRHWRRNLKPHATFVLGLWLLGPDEQPTCSGWVDSGGAFAAVSLPTSWFTDVWARGIALVDGCLVLSRDDATADGSSFPVVAVRWQREGGGISGAKAAPAVVSATPDGRRSIHWI